MKKVMSKAIFLALVGITASAVSARADVMIYQGLEGGSGDVQNVLFNDQNSNDVGFTVDGFLNQGGQVVLFSSSEMLATPSGGQARIVAADGEFTDVAFNMQDPTLGFSKVQFNIDAVDDGQINLVFTDQFNTDWSGTFDLNGSGQNFFTAISYNGQVITSVSLDSTVGLSLSDLAQVRLNPVPISGVVAEPATMVLLGAGMIGLGIYGSRKRKK